jgi:hypothetical protein
VTRRIFSCLSSGVALLSLAACEVPEGVEPTEPGCLSDRECADGNLCNGLERCVEGVCEAARDGGSDAFVCDAGGVAVVECAESAPCGRAVGCPAPGVPVVGFVPPGVELPVRWTGSESGLPIEVAVARPGELPERWAPVVSARIDLDALDPSSAGTSGDDRAGRLSVWLRSASGCEGDIHVADFDRQVPASGPEAEGATGEGSAWRAHIDAGDPRITGWAVACVDFRPGERVDPVWLAPHLALGPAGVDPYDVLTLGEGGEATFALPVAIGNGPGPDLAVFENAVPDDFLELARVEVSTDGVHFAAFDTLSLIPDPVGTYDRMDASRLDGFAGPTPVGQGMPFDLARLARHPAVLEGLVDLGAIRFVRIVDVVGDGALRDSFGHPIFDPFPTWGSAGFDLDAIAVLAPDAAP